MQSTSHFDLNALPMGVMIYDPACWPGMTR